MTSSWFGKKDDGPLEADAVSPTPTNDADELVQLTRGLGDVEQRLGELGRQLAGYLLRRESRAAPGGAGSSSDQVDAEVAELSQAMGRVAKKLDELAAAQSSHGSAAAASSSISRDDLEATIRPLLEKFEHLDKQGEACRQAVADVHRLLDGGLRGLADLLAPKEEPQPDGGGPAASADWEMAVLGPDLTADPRLALYRDNLLGGVLSADAGAKALAGQLLVFQSTAPEKLPQLLKDIGEAYYRWQPRDTPEETAMESALVQWLHRACEGVGINNRIELVHPGERLDSSRHTAAARGVEITEVYGWIVLRDNGTVYTKAAVAAR